MDKFVKDTITEVIGKTLQNDEDLFLAGLDSLGVLKIISLIENEYNIEIDDNELEIDNLKTINSILNMVKKYVWGF